MEIKEIKNLFLSGGGLKGIAFLGSLYSLEKHNFNKTQLENIYGISIGSIIAFLYIIGYEPKELKRILLKTEYKNYVSFDIIKLIKQKGLDDGNKIISLIEQWVEVKNVSKDITFIEFFKKFNINLHIGVSNIDKQEQCFFNKNNQPDMKILLAIRMSISIPFLFSPVLFQKELYVDGEIIHQFPMGLLPLNDLLYLTFTSEENTQTVQKTYKYFDLYNYIYKIYKCISYKKEIPVISNLIQIPTQAYDILNIYMSKERKNILFKNGYKSVSNFFK